MHTPEQIKLAIKDLPLLSVEELAHCFKCASATKNKIYKQYMEAIERELRKRSKVQTEDSLEPEE